MTLSAKTIEPEITACLLRVRSGSTDAFVILFNFYIQRLRGYVVGRLSDRDRGEGIEDDLSVETMYCLWFDLSGGRFSKVNNRDELWYAIMRIAKSRMIDRHRYLSRIRRAAIKTISLSSLVIGSKTQSEIDQFIIYDAWKLFTESLEDQQLKELVRMKMDGLSSDVVAEQLGLVPRTVQRKLKIIRELWEDFVFTRNCL